MRQRKWESERVVEWEVSQINKRITHGSFHSSDFFDPIFLTISTKVMGDKVGEGWRSANMLAVMLLCRV
jgi:hypothetical protein